MSSVFRMPVQQKGRRTISYNVSHTTELEAISVVLAPVRYRKGTFFHKEKQGSQP